MAARNLGDARRLFRARRFPEVIRLLEPEVFRFRESADYFLMLGTACLHTGDLGGAASYLGRARQIKPGSVTALLGMAAVHFKKAETEPALKLWLEALDATPGACGIMYTTWLNKYALLAGFGDLVSRPRKILPLPRKQG